MSDFANFGNFSKLRTAVYPPRMAPIGAKLWENAFQTIPDISFFDAEKKKLTILFPGQIKKLPFGGATIFWPFLAGPSRKITPDELDFSSV